MSPLSRRTSVSFYAETQKQLSALEAVVTRQQLPADRTDIIRALVHCTPEPEIMARATLRDTWERSPEGRALGGVVEFAPVRMSQEDFDKLERVLERLRRAEITVSLAVLIRALIAHPPTPDRMAAMIRQTRADFPDGRALRWQKK